MTPMQSGRYLDNRMTVVAKGRMIDSHTQAGL